MRTFIIPTVLVLIGVLSFFSYTMPAYDEVKTLRASIEEYDTALSRVTEIQQIRDQLLSRYNSLPESSLYVLYKILPDEVNSVRFLIELDQIATEYGLTIQEPSYNNIDDEDSNDPFRSTEVTFMTTGAYEDVSDFIQVLERSARLLDMRELSVLAISPSGSGASVPSGRMNEYQFTVQIYSLNGLPEQE